MQPCVAGEYNWLEKRGIRTPGSSRELIFNAGDRKTDRPESDRKPEDISWPDADPERLLEANRTCKLFDPAHDGSYHANKYLNAPASEFSNGLIGCPQSETSKALAEASELLGLLADALAAWSDPGGWRPDPFDLFPVEPYCP